MCILLWRQRTEPTNKDVVSLLEKQMKLCGVSPETIKRESQEQGRRTFGTTIAEMEQTEPAEYIKQHNLYYDYDKLGKDFKDIVRAMKNIMIDSSDAYEYGNNKIDIDSPVGNIPDVEDKDG
jgi:DeoR/GlpR family transcriptional regulator of sugar metabolism